MSNKWDVELLTELEGILGEIGFIPTIEDFNGKPVLVMEYSGGIACEDCNLSVEHLTDDITAIGVLFTLKSDLDEKQTSDIVRLLPYLNKYLSFGAFSVLEEEGFFCFTASFIIKEDCDRSIIINSISNALTLGLFTTGRALEITLPVISGEASAEELMNEESIIFQL